MDERIVAGVAAGIAHYFALPVWLVRAAFVVLALPIGLGMWAYILAAFAMPPTGVPRPDTAFDRLAGWVRRAPGWMWAVLGIVVAIFAVTAARRERQADLVAGVALLIAGALVLAPRRTRAGEGPEASANAPIPPAPANAARSTPRAPRERSKLGWITLGAAVAATGFAALLDRTGAVPLEPAQYLALPTMILGAGMLVGARWGRARWLTIPALMLTPPLVLASVVDVPFTGGYAERYARPEATSDVAPLYELAGGRWIIDLRELDLTGRRPVRISAQVAVGTLDVWLPASANLDLHAAADWGYVQVVNWNAPGAAEYGFQLDVERSAPGRKAGGAVRLDLRVGIGQIQVYRGFPNSYGSWTY